MNIFISCSLTHIKIKNSELYITRLHTSFWVDGEYSSKVTHIESCSPQENSLRALDQFTLDVDRVIKLYPNETFSHINTKRAKYRCFDVFTSLEVNNLIKVDKGE